MIKRLRREALQHRSKQGWSFGPAFLQDVCWCGGDLKLQTPLFEPFIGISHHERRRGFLEKGVSVFRS